MSPFGYRRYRNENARMDAAAEDYTLRAAGVIEDDEPTEYSHYAHMVKFEREATGEFSKEERMQIRSSLGMTPFGAGDAT